MHITPLKGRLAKELDAVKIQEMNPAQRPKKENLILMMEAFQRGGKAEFLEEWNRIFPGDQLSSQEKQDLMAKEPSPKS